MTFDRLPKRKELVFEQARKTLYLQLTTVIRSLSVKFRGTLDQWQVYTYVEKINMPMGSAQIFVKTTIGDRVFCVCDDIRRTIPLYQIFLAGKNGDLTHTRKLRAGIERLEFLRDNWDDLEITGNLKNGYRLVLKSEES